MSKNVASDFPKLVALIVFSAVVPDWECKSGRFIFNMQMQDANIFRKFSAEILNRLIKKMLGLKKSLKFFRLHFLPHFKWRKTDSGTSYFSIY